MIARLGNEGESMLVKLKVRMHRLVLDFIFSSFSVEIDSSFLVAVQSHFGSGLEREHIMGFDDILFISGRGWPRIDVCFHRDLCGIDVEVVPGLARAIESIRRVTCKLLPRSAGCRMRGRDAGCGELIAAFSIGKTDLPLEVQDLRIYDKC